MLPGILGWGEKTGGRIDGGGYGYQRKKGKDGVGKTVPRS